ncbi:MAG: PspC domain-containing protein [Melioribacter sp.]|nr:PspC domain-containing protein [Melioribacter sp.]
MKDKLYRSRRMRVFGGIAGGLAQYFNLDPILVRVLFVVVTILHGFGILLYIILWIVVPEEPFEIAYKVNTDDQTAGEQSAQTDSTNFDGTQPIPQKQSSGRIVLGIILIVIGLIFFADRIIPSFDLRDVLPIAFVLIGGSLIWNSLKK